MSDGNIDQWAKMFLWVCLAASLIILIDGIGAHTHYMKINTSSGDITSPSYLFWCSGFLAVVGFYQWIFRRQYLKRAVSFGLSPKNIFSMMSIGIVLVTILLLIHR